MEGALSWFGSLIEWFGQWIPHILIVRTTHGGVKFIRGHKVKEIKPGIHLYWPITTDVEIIPIVRQTFNLKSQRIATQDNKTISVSVVIIFMIDDVLKALTETWCYHDTVCDTAQAAVVEVLVKKSYDELVTNIDTDIKNQLSITVRKRLKKFGVYVESAQLSDYAKTLVVTTISGE